MRSRTSERGFALAGAIFALVIIATLVAGSFFAARQEMNIGRASAIGERAFDAAEAGLNRTIALWSTSSLNAMAVGDSVGSAGSLASNGGNWSVYTRRLNNELFLIRSTGSSGGSERQLAQLARLQIINMQISAGLTTRSSLKLGGSSFIDGVDTSPSGWACPAVTDTVSGVRTADSTQITFSGCSSSNPSCIRGNPKIENDPSIDSTTFFQFGDVDWAELVAMATITYPGSAGPLNQLAPVTTGGACDASNTNNWGEPWRGAGTVSACYGYLPIIYVNGDLQITGGRGQGILLVENDISVQGGFEFYGPVIARGNLITQGTGGHFNGGVLAANVDLQQSTVLGNAVITYSSCSISRALNANSSGRMLAQRSWVDLVQ